MTGFARPEDLARLRTAAELAGRCVPSRTAFSVGALIVADDGTVLATGWSRRGDPVEHAEEAALGRFGSGLGVGDPRLRDATLYSTLEPCSARASRPRSCTGLILGTPIARVVFAWREPALFVNCDGAELLRASGREVVEVPELADLAREPNAHLLRR